MGNRLLKHLRDSGKPYFGNREPLGKAAIAELSTPQLQTFAITDPDRPRKKPTASADSVVGKLNLLPYLDETTGETAAHREAYRKMLRDSSIKTALLSKILPLASLDLVVNPADPDDPRHVEIAEYVRWNLLNVGLGVPGVTVGVCGLVEALTLPKLIDGYSLASKRYEPLVGGKYHGKNRLAEVTSKPPKTYTLGLDEFGRVKRVIGRQHNSGYEYDPGAFVVGRYLPLYDNSLGMSDLRAAYRAFWMKDTVWKLRAIYQEKYAVGGLVGKYSNPDDKSALEEALASWRSSSFLSVPDSVMVDAIAMAGKGDTDYAAALKDLDQEIMVGITGAFLQAMEGQKTGSLAMGRVHKSTSELFVWYLAENLAGDINGQVVPDIVAMNYAGVPEMPPAVTVSFGGVNDADMAAAIAVDKGLPELGWKHSKEALGRKYKCEWAKDEADEVAPPSPPPAPAPAPTIPFSDTPAREVPAADPFGERSAVEFADVAIGGQAGRQLLRLMQESKTHGEAVMHRLCRQAVERILKAPGRGTLFAANELQELADSLASTIGTANLLGRYRIRSILNRRRPPAQTFAEPAGPPVAPIPPEKALSYFRSLAPGITGDPGIFGPMMRRQAFTLAVSTDAMLLQKVQGVIADTLATGGGTIADVQEILDKAGVSPRNPQYAEMVYRTNAMDAYNSGFDEERQDPEVINYFPVWRYDTADDERVGDDHRPKDGKYFPAAATFAEVRGDRPFNCRCGATPIYVDDWEELKKGGARVESSW